jgi:electron transfer flavoprotein alpha/beta subunit
MRIVVPIKQVPETRSVKMDEKTGTVIRDGVESIVNPLDLYSIEAALMLKERFGGETVAVTMGPPQAATALKEALAMGIDQAVLISDRAFAGSDTWATAYVLGEAIKTLGDYDLIICGERATDGDTGQVGPEMAAYLELPVATYVNGVNDCADGELTVTRLVEHGEEIVSMQLPGILTVVKEVSDPRLPTLNGKIRARETELPQLSFDDLELDVKNLGLKGSPTRVVKIFRPKVARECEILTAENEDAVVASTERMYSFLQEREMV